MINPGLNIQALRNAYIQNGAISIQNILQPQSAEAVYTDLADLPWEIEIKDYTQAEALAVPESELGENEYILNALDKFPHTLDTNQLFFARKKAALPNLENTALKNLTDLIGSESFLDKIRMISGRQDIQTSWIEATCYDKNCFLGAHRDDHHPDNKIAFVLNLTREWKLDWGGLLMLQLRENQPPVIVPPTWNSLSMFNVPVDHTVSCVSPHATGRRYSLTGWFR